MLGDVWTRARSPLALPWPPSALQAFKSANLSATEVLYWLTGLCAVTVLPISLGVDGTDWGAQFRGMDGSDWAALMFSSCCAHIGSVLGIQVRQRPLAYGRRAGFRRSLAGFAYLGLRAWGCGGHAVRV